MFREVYLYLSKGGVVMIPILLCSVVALTLFFERLWSLRRRRIVPFDFTDKFVDLVQQGEESLAYELCSESHSAISRIALKGLSHRKYERSTISEAMLDENSRQAALMERFVSVIGSIASISPLLGLLGTVTGMIQVFSRVADVMLSGGEEMHAGILANGIWEALLTTAAGLMVAIPVFLLHRIIVSIIDQRQLELDVCMTRIIDVLRPAALAED